MNDFLSSYLKEYVNQGFKKIFAEQQRIAANKIYRKQAYDSRGHKRSRSGNLQRALQSASLDMSVDKTGLNAKTYYPTYLRFLDMKRLGNYRIYNRPLWGILYRETLVDIKYEFRQWLQKNFTQEIIDAYKPLNKLQ